ncbi:MAG: hypothetical protein WDO69_33455 [Pseudomonadota bacterium]
MSRSKGSNKDPAASHIPSELARTSGNPVDAAALNLHSDGSARAVLRAQIRREASSLARAKALPRPAVRYAAADASASVRADTTERVANVLARILRDQGRST